jgi:hypothetical protein
MTRSLTLALICGGALCAALGCSNSQDQTPSRPMTANDVAALVAEQPSRTTVAMSSGDPAGRHVFSRDQEMAIVQGPVLIQTADLGHD